MNSKHSLTFVKGHDLLPSKPCAQTHYVIALTGSDAFVANGSSFKLGCADCIPVLLYSSDREHALTFPSMIAASVWAFMALPFSKWSVEPL
jgi:hypothetical protein